MHMSAVDFCVIVYVYTQMCVCVPSVSVCMLTANVYVCVCAQLYYAAQCSSHTATYIVSREKKIKKQKKIRNLFTSH